MKQGLFFTSLTTIATIIVVGIHHHSLILTLFLCGLVGWILLTHWNKGEESLKSAIATTALVAVLTALLGR